MNHQEITERRTATPKEVDHAAAHRAIAAEIDVYLRSGHEIEHVADGVCTDDPLKRNGVKAIQVVKKGKR